MNGRLPTTEKAKAIEGENDRSRQTSQKDTLKRIEYKDAENANNKEQIGP